MRNSSSTPDLRPAPVVDRHKNAVAAFDDLGRREAPLIPDLEGSDGVFVAVDNWGRSKVWSPAGIAHLSGVPRSRRHGNAVAAFDDLGRREAPLIPDLVKSPLEITHHSVSAVIGRCVRNFGGS